MRNEVLMEWGCAQHMFSDFMRLAAVCHVMQEEAQAWKQELQRKREEERAVIAGTEPAAGTEGAVLVRVRLPTGSSKQRWFVGDSHMADVLRWVCCLEEMPLTGETWKLNSYPRVVLEGTRTLSDVAAGTSAVALFVEAA